MRRSKERIAVNCLACLVALCCATASLDATTARDAESLLNSSATPTQRDAGESTELADLLELDADREDTENHDPATRTVDDQLQQYEARLLADRRVFYGYSRPVDATKRAEEEKTTEQDANVATESETKTARPQPVVLESQYGESATNVSRPRFNPTTTFNSSAYQSKRDDAEPAQPQEETLELHDVELFSREEETEGRDRSDAALEDAAYEEADAPAEDSLVALEDECFAALDHYTALFIEYEPTYEWTDSILQDVESILRTIEESPIEAQALVAELKRKAEEASAIKTTLERADRREHANQSDPWNGAEKPRLIARYTLAQRLELLESFKNALERRIFLWNHATNFFAARARGALLEPQDFAREELAALMKATTDVRRYFGDDANGRSWRASFDVDALLEELRQELELPAPKGARVSRDARRQQSRRGYLENEELAQYAFANAAEPYLDKIQDEAAKNDPIEIERARRAKFLHDRINAIAYKIEKTPMTQEQRRVFQRSAPATWSNLVTGLARDYTNGMALLVAFEKHERIAGGDSGRALQQIALRMTTSQSETCRALGRSIDVLYDNPNVKAYVSEALVNRMLPVRDPEFAVVQETILNNPVVGRRRVDTEVSISLLPDPNRLLMTLNINGKIRANTSSAVMNAKLHNESYASYAGRKTLEWRDSGLAYSPAVVNANSQSVLNSVETDLDFVPLVGDLARGVARTQYEQRQRLINAESRAKVVNQTRAQFDQEANERFDEFNAKLRDGFLRNLANLGLSLRTQRSRTTDDWLLASLRFGADYALGCQTNEPETPAGAFADVKTHESSVNSFLAQLDLAGRAFTPEEALAYIAKKLDAPKLAETPIEENELSFTFADDDPITVRFQEDRICLVLRFANLTLGRNSWDNIETEVVYRPTILEDGAPSFIRDGAIALYGPASVMEQIPIRTVFSKIFPAQKSFDLRVDALRKDERFAGLALGLCRVSNGWFAVSVIKDPRYAQRLQKSYL